MTEGIQMYRGVGTCLHAEGRRTLKLGFHGTNSSLVRSFIRSFLRPSLRTSRFEISLVILFPFLTPWFFVFFLDILSFFNFSLRARFLFLSPASDRFIFPYFPRKFYCYYFLSADVNNWNFLSNIFCKLKLSWILRISVNMELI